MHVPLAHEPPQHSSDLLHALPAGLQMRSGPLMHFAPSHLPEQHASSPLHAASSALQTPAGNTHLPPPQLPEQHCQSALHACVVDVQEPGGGTQSSLLHDPEQHSPSDTHAVLNFFFRQIAGAASTGASVPASCSTCAGGADVSLFGTAGAPLLLLEPVSFAGPCSSPVRGAGSAGVTV